MVTSRALTPLKFRCAQNQTSNYAQIHLLARIVELGLQNLRIIELFLERLHRRWSRLPAEKNLYGAIQRRLWLRGRLHAEQRSYIGARSAHLVAGERERIIQAIQQRAGVDPRVSFVRVTRWRLALIERLADSPHPLNERHGRVC